jgi:hypothetical protein
MEQEQFDQGEAAFEAVHVLQAARNIVNSLRLHEVEYVRIRQLTEALLAIDEGHGYLVTYIHMVDDNYPPPTP